MNNLEYKSNSDRNKTQLVAEYLEKIRPYLKDIINDLKNSDTWKIQLTITISFISSKDDNHKQHVINSKSDNIEFAISNKTDEIIEKLFFFFSFSLINVKIQI